MTKQEFFQAVNDDMTAAANKVCALKAQQAEIGKQIEYWARQEDAARTLSIRLSVEANQPTPNPVD